MSDRVSETFKRTLIVSVLAAVIVSTGIGSGLAAINYLEPLRWYVGGSLVVGGLIGSIAMVRNVDEGPVMPALLAVSIITQAATVLGGLGFLLVGLAQLQDGSTITIEPSFGIVVAWGCYTAFATAELLLGGFLHFGYAYHWLSRDVQKTFWRSDNNSKDEA
jgi:hypothetical protein